MSQRLAVLTLGLFSAAVLLSACGKQGDLDRPAPLFGERAKRQYEEYQAKKAAGELTKADEDPNAPHEDNAGDATDVVAPPKDDATTTPLPPRTAPITGSSPDPFGSGPQGALPNPYADPNRSR